MNNEARTSLFSALLALSILGFIALCMLNGYLMEIWFLYWGWILTAHVLLTNVILLLLYEGRVYQIAVRSCLLGLCMAVGIILMVSQMSISLFGWYLTLLAFFHWSEYMTTALANPDHLTLESFLLDHSPEYHLAALASIIEFLTEWYFFPGFKQVGWLSICGLLMVLGGEALRKAAMITASTNFNHYVQHVKKDGHRLITHGVYSLCRHPSYVGWFFWSIGTQVMLCNPVCCVGYTLVSWRFFRFRVEHEEVTLINFFGEEYIQYQERVGTGLPFIHGCKMQL